MENQKQTEVETTGWLSENLLCPITQEVMNDPVIAADGFSYEREAIEKWISTRGNRSLSPMTGERLAHLELQENKILRIIITQQKEHQPKRRQRVLTQQDLLLAIKLREEELTALLEKRTNQMQQCIHEKQEMVRALEPLEQENKQLQVQLTEQTRNNEQLTLDSNQKIPLRNRHLTKQVSHILSQTCEFESLEESISANLIKQALRSRLIKKRLNSTRLEQRNEQIAHQLEVVREEKNTAEKKEDLQYQTEQIEAEDNFKKQLEAIKTAINTHAEKEGDDDAIMQLAQQRKDLRLQHQIIVEKLASMHQQRQEVRQKQTNAQLSELMNEINQIKSAKESKRRELSQSALKISSLTACLETQVAQLFSAIEALSKTRVEINKTIDELCESPPYRFAPRLTKQAASSRFFTSKHLVEPIPSRANNNNAPAIYAEKSPSEMMDNQAKVIHAKDIHELLRHVMRGDLDNVKRMLKANPNLAYSQGDITDLSKRTFPDITAFQYAIWALDEPMQDLILNYLPENSAKEQFQAFVKERSDITQKHGVHFSFDELRTAYENYIDSFGRSYWKENNESWCKHIGSAQRMLPAWVIMMMCEEGYNVAWLKKNIDMPVKRDGKHLTWWFDCVINGGKLGITWAAWRGGNHSVCGRDELRGEDLCGNNHRVKDGPLVMFNNIAISCNHKFDALKVKYSMEQTIESSSEGLTLDSFNKITSNVRSNRN